MSGRRENPAREPGRDLRTHLDDLLQQCVQCGLCLPVCATYLATGDEALSPRGRLLLLGEALDDGSIDEPEASFAAAWDLCLGCRACETACPSGVPFTLLEEAKEMGVGRRTASARRLSGVVSSPRVLAGIKRLKRAMDRVLNRSADRPRSRAAAGWKGALSTPLDMLAGLPTAPDTDPELCRLLDRLSGRVSDPVAFPTRDPEAPVAGRVVMLSGCANSALLGATQRRLVRILEAAGISVDIPAGQECCGALAEHSHNRDAAVRIAQRNTEILALALEGADALLVEAAGCGAQLQTYPKSVSGKSRDAVAYLDTLELPPLRILDLKVAIHDPCHARHAQGIFEEPRRLLRRIPGLELIEPPEPDVCCGGAGPYTLFHPVFSAEMGRRKAGLLAGTGADLVVTTNPGCLGQIAAGFSGEGVDMPILPLSDLLWYAMLQE